MIVVLIKAFAYVTVLMIGGYAVFHHMLTAQARREMGLVLLPAFLTLTFFCFFSPSLWILHIVALGIIPTLARTRRDAAIFLIVLSCATPPFYTVVAAEGVSFFRWSVQNSLSLGALFAFAIARGPIIRRRPSADVALVLMVVLLIFVAARDSSITNLLRETSIALFNLILPYWVITRGIDPAEDGRKLLLWLAGAATMIAMVAIYEAITFWPLYRIAGMLFEQHGSGMFVLRMGFMRAAGPLANATVLGYVLVCTFVAAVLARPCFRGSIHQGWVVAVIAGGIVASQSRGAMLGAATAMVLLTVFNPRKRNPMLAFLALGVASVFATLMMLVTRYEPTAAETLSYRRQLMARGTEEFWKHPFWGDAIGEVTKRMRDLTTGEQIVDFVNTYLYFALAAGIFGTLVFVVIILIEPFKLWWRQRYFSSHPNYVATARLCFAFLLSSALMLVFTSLSDRMIMLLIGMAGVSGTITAGRIRSTPAPPSDIPELPSDISELPRTRPVGVNDIPLPQLREPELPHL